MEERKGLWLLGRLWCCCLGGSEEPPSSLGSVGASVERLQDEGLTSHGRFLLDEREQSRLVSLEKQQRDLKWTECRGGYEERRIPGASGLLNAPIPREQ